MPLYLNTFYPGTDVRLVLDPRTGLPVYQGMCSINFTVLVPASLAGNATTPPAVGKVVQYGTEPRSRVTPRGARRLLRCTRSQLASLLVVITCPSFRTQVRVVYRLTALRAVELPVPAVRVQGTDCSETRARWKLATWTGKPTNTATCWEQVCDVATLFLAACAIAGARCMHRGSRTGIAFCMYHHVTWLSRHLLLRSSLDALLPLHRTCRFHCSGLVGPLRIRRTICCHYGCHRFD